MTYFRGKGLQLKKFGRKMIMRSTMKSIAEGLPPEIAEQVHPDWRKNEAEYWANRKSLLGKYRDTWIAFADGAVISSGKSPVEVFHEAQKSGAHPFVICVGRESEPCRMRRASFRYDSSYPSEALPVISVSKKPGIGGTNTPLDSITMLTPSSWTFGSAKKNPGRNT